MAKQRDEILRLVDAATEAENMSLGQAIEFISELMCDLDVRLDALKEDLNREQDDAATNNT